MFKNRPGSYNVDKPNKQKRRANTNQPHRPYTAGLASIVQVHDHAHTHGPHGIINPPSIPTSHCKYGYDQTPTGQLIPRKAPPSTTLSQQKSQSTSMLTQSSKPSAWSLSTSKRFIQPSTIYTGDVKELKEIHKYEKKKRKERKKKLTQATKSVKTKSARKKSYNRQISTESTKTNKSEPIMSNNKENKHNNHNNHSNINNTNDNNTNQPQIPNQIQKVREENKQSRERFFAKIKQNKMNPVSSMFASTSVRFQDESVKTKDLPGPGAYDVATDLNNNKDPTAKFNRSIVQPKKMIEYKPVKTKNNGMGQKYNITPKEEPGPGAYEIPSCFKSIDDVQTESILLGKPNKAPFTSSVPRFIEGINDNIARYEPGPQDYQSLDGANMISSQYTDVSNTVIDAKTHQKLALTRLHNGYFTVNYHRAPFGTHGSRFHQIKLDSDYFPGPGKYNVRHEVTKRQRTGSQYSGGATNVFRSKLPRNSYLIESQDQTNPPPGTYDVAQSFQNLISHKHAVSRS